MNFKLHTTFETLQPFETAWNDLLTHSVTHVPFLRYEYLAAWWQTRGGGEWPDSTLAVISAHENDQLIGVAPLFHAKNRGGESALLLLGSIEISDYLDLIVSPDQLPGFSTGLFAFLRSNPALTWDALDLYNLPEGSPSLPALEAAALSQGWTLERTQLQSCPAIQLPGDWETYLNGIDKKQRHEIKRKMRRAEESGRNLRWYIVDDERQLDSEMEAFMALMAHDPEKAAFLTDVMRAQVKTSAQAAFQKGWLQLAMMEVDGQKACGYLNFDYDNKIYVYNSGMDRAFMDLSPGWVMLGYLLQWANDHRRAEFDFMRGDEDYKYKFGGKDRLVFRVKVTK
jgi:CelD/BcsL family acetyltransferase involved in cellulose biosynthesis